MVLSGGLPVFLTVNLPGNDRDHSGRIKCATRSVKRFVGIQTSNPKIPEFHWGDWVEMKYF